jgi:anti-sigma factor RsiW
MMNEQANNFNCSQFEELLTDYLDRTLDAGVNGQIAAHAMSCPLCHTLLNDVKDSMHACRTITAPAMPMTRLEARIISMTAPATAMSCEDFEEHLTDYLDGFLPAAAFHRWERHAALCTSCEELPGTVVRSIAACYTFKAEELAVPAGLHSRILEATLGTAKAEEILPSWGARAAEWIRGLRFPVSIPQLAPVAMMMAIAFFVFSQTVSADGSLTGVYQRSVELAEQTYTQTADAWTGKPQEIPATGVPVSGTTTISNDDGK